ncbi:MAG: glycosyltransferase family 4 protein [Pseudomonadaceae bacterium]|nr:glycosyltransferase family 4 protein [Pseudomonadaceae bacterium]
MRLLQLCPNDHPPFAQITARYADALADLGHDVVTVFVGPAQAEPVAGAVYLNVTKAADAPDALRRWLVSEPGNGDFTAMIAHRYRAMRTALAVQWGRPILCIAHEFGLARSLRRQLWLRLFARHVRFAAVSAPVQQELASHLKRHVLELPNAVDVAEYQSGLLSREQARAELGLAADEFAVGVVGRLHWKKQPAVALAAYKKAREDNWRLIFVGDGDERSVLDVGASEQADVRFEGYRTDAQTLYRAFDRVLLASNDHEAFSMVALEAGLAGVPIVSTPAPGPMHVLQASAAFASDASPDALALALKAEPIAPDVNDLAERFDVSALSARLHAILKPIPVNERT